MNSSQPTPSAAPSFRSRWILLLGVAALAVLFLLLASRKTSRWHVGFDFTHWQISASEMMEFDQGGLQVRSKTTRYFGPITISSERIWKSDDARPVIGPGYF